MACTRLPAIATRTCSAAPAEARTAAGVTPAARVLDALDGGGQDLRQGQGVRVAGPEFQDQGLGQGLADLEGDAGGGEEGAVLDPPQIGPGGGAQVRAEGQAGRAQASPPRRRPPSALVPPR